MKKQELLSLIKQDNERLLALHAVRALKLPQCYIAAGFVRNLVWDKLHHKSTPSNDIDVIFYDAQDSNNQKAQWAQQMLSFRYPSVKWQVKNQALMHERNGDEPYNDCIDAMAHWPEKETAVAVSLNNENKLELINAFELDSLFDGLISHNPQRELSVFFERIAQKRWLEIWPKLKVVH